MPTCLLNCCLTITLSVVNRAEVKQHNGACRPKHQPYNCISDPLESECCPGKHGDTHLWVCDNFGSHGEDSAAHPEGGVALKIMQGAGVNGVRVVIPVQH